MGYTRASADVSIMLTHGITPMLGNSADAFRGLLLLIAAVFAVTVLPIWWAASRRRSDAHRKTRAWAFFGGLVLFTAALGRYIYVPAQPFYIDAPPSQSSTFTSLVFVVLFIAGPWLAAWGFAGKEVEMAEGGSVKESIGPDGS